MIDQRVHDDLVTRLYASAMGEVLWPDTLDRIGAAFGAGIGVMQVSQGTQPLAIETHGYSREFIADFYNSDIYRNDPRMPYFAQAPLEIEGVYYDSMLFDVESMIHDPRVRATEEILKALYSLGGMFHLPDGIAGALAVFIPREQGHPDQSAIGSFQRLMPHIRQSASLGQLVQQNAATRGALLEALAAKADGVILLGLDGRPSFMNAAAEAVLAADDGLAWRGEQFTARRGSETRCLHALIRDVLARPLGDRFGRGGLMAVTRPSGRRAYVVEVLAAPPTETFLTVHSVACVVRLYDLASARSPSTGTLRTVFGLSAREADLAAALMSSLGVADAAAAAGMAVNTARNHLQSIFRKCGVTSQTEAVQLFARLP